MKINSIILLIVLSLHGLYLSSCQEEAVVCTMEWRAYSVTIKDSSGKPIRLDDYYSQNKITGEIVRFQDNESYLDSIQKSQGIYIIISDGQKHWAKYGFFKFLFKGFKGDSLLVSEEYNIEADVCHIGDLEGNLEIVIK